MTTSLWAAEATDATGTVSIKVLPNPDGLRMDVTISQDAGDLVQTSGLTVGRADVQDLYRGLIAWLANSSERGLP